MPGVLNPHTGTSTPPFDRASGNVFGEPVKCLLPVFVVFRCEGEGIGGAVVSVPVHSHLEPPEDALPVVGPSRGVLSREGASSVKGDEGKVNAGIQESGVLEEIKE